MKSSALPTNFDDLCVDGIVNDCLLAMDPYGVSGLVILAPSITASTQTSSALVVHPPALLPSVQELLQRQRNTIEQPLVAELVGYLSIGSQGSEYSQAWLQLLEKHGFQSLVQVAYPLPAKRYFLCIALSRQVWSDLTMPSRIAWQMQLWWPKLKAQLITSRGILSAREVQCLQWAFHGLTAKEAAQQMGCTERTVNFHMNNILTKLRADTKLAAVQAAIHLGYL
jgi:LuxR family transcriptional regulator, quorum-sensing system regulator SolR